MADEKKVTDAEVAEKKAKKISAGMENFSCEIIDAAGEKCHTVTKQCAAAQEKRSA